MSVQSSIAVTSNHYHHDNFRQYRLAAVDVLDVGWIAGGKMQRSFQSKAWILLLFVILILFRLVLQFALYKAGFISLTADEFGRTIAAARWSKHPHLYWHGPWLPLHSYFLGTMLSINWELLWMPRLTNVLFGLISIMFVYLLAYSLFKSRLTGLLSAFLLSVNPAHIWLSGVPLTEVPCTMFVLIGIWAFSRYLENASNIYLFTSTLALAIANGFRYEAWFISVIFTVAILYGIFIDFLKQRIKVKKMIIMIMVAWIPWFFPLGWIIGSYMLTQNPLAFLVTIKSYKVQWYGQTTNYYNYLETFLKIDPYLTFLGLIGVIVCLFSEDQVSSVRLWYTITTVIPLSIFIVLHGGQLEPPGNYIRYLSPLSFTFYPALGYLLFVSVRKLRSGRLKVWFLMGLLTLIVATQVTRTFHFTNDPAADGLAVGQTIRELRQNNPDLHQNPVVIELSYWQYLAIHVGANDLDNIIYDRSLDIQSRKTQSLLLLDPQQFAFCLIFYDVSYVVMKDPLLRTMIEDRLGLRPIKEVNGYTFYTTEGLSTELSEKVETCSLSFGSGY